MLFDLVYFINIILSFIVGFYLLFKLNPIHKGFHISSLAWYFILNAFCFSFYLIIKYELILYVPYLYKIPAPINYLIAPMAYFHVRFISFGKVELKKIDVLHFIPFLIFAISYLDFYFMGFSDKQAYVSLVIEDFSLSFTDSVGFIPEYMNSIGRIIHPFFYLSLQWIILFKNKSIADHKSNNKLYKWVSRLTLIQTIYVFNLFITVLIITIYPTFNENSIYSNIPAVLTILFFFTLSVYLFWNQDVLMKLKKFQPLNNKTNVINSNSYFDKISEQVVQNEYFTDPDLNLTKLSTILNINTKELSLCISSQDLNYNSWLNNLRIEYSIRLIKEGFLNTYSVEALAIKCGFNSKNTFYRSFKRVTDTTPTELFKTTHN